MQLATSEQKDVKLDMTSMIDIVFQLLVFFIMTFKVVEMEGDFNIRMPLASLSDSPNIDEVLPDLITVKLKAGENGGMNSVIVDDSETYDDENWYTNLTDYVEKQLSREGNPEAASKTELEFDIDYGLKYSHTVKAIEAVSGRIQPDGSVKKLIEKVKFKDNSTGG